MERYYSVLLVSKHTFDGRRIGTLLDAVPDTKISVYRLETIAKAVATLRNAEYDALILDLPTLGSAGWDNLRSFLDGAADVPVIIITADDDEETALQALRLGAQDCLPKNSLDTSLLFRALQYAIERKKRLQENQKTIAKLHKTLADHKILSGLVSICSGCKKVRNEKGDWEQIEYYLKQHSEMVFTHGLCPDCIRKYYPDFDATLLDDDAE